MVDSVALLLHILFCSGLAYDLNVYTQTENAIDRGRGGQTQCFLYKVCKLQE